LRGFVHDLLDHEEVDGQAVRHPFPYAQLMPWGSILHRFPMPVPLDTDGLKDRSRIMSNKLQKDGKWPFSRAALIRVLAPAAVVLALSILFGSFRAPEEQLPKASLADCQSINEAPGRLACYDMLAKQHVPIPAKGGQAILSSEAMQ
jgi:hypothetical protein